MESLRILIADDQPLGTMALRSQLEALGHTVVGAARDGREAVAMAACEGLDLLIMDQRMPEMSGLQAAARIFEGCPVPVVLLTGYAGGDLDEEGPRPPVVHHLVKPIDLQGLRGGIDAALERFRRWLDAQQDSDGFRRCREDRERLAAACARVAAEAGVSQLDACRRLAEQDADPELAALARAALDDAAIPAAD